jgi:hypothetical protein
MSSISKIYSNTTFVPGSYKKKTHETLKIISLSSTYRGNSAKNVILRRCDPDIFKKFANTGSVVVCLGGGGFGLLEKRDQIGVILCHLQ